jgi:hypothetical protein
VLDGHCPDYVDHDRWRQAVGDGKRFLVTWRTQALGWTARNLFGLHTPPKGPHPSYRRLSRYDETGLIWLLEGREVIALTEETAAIRWPSGAVTVYRKHNKPTLGPVGDSLGDLNDTAAIHIPAATDADRRARCAAPGCGRPIAALVFAIELEIEGRRVTDAQLLAIEDIRAASGHAEICRRLDAAIKQQKDWQLLWGRP